MNWLKRLSVCAASLMIVASVIAQAEPPTSQPAGHDQQDPKTAAARGSSGRWGFAPFNRLSNVTEEQKQKINDIHRRANSDIKAIKEKEEADIMAILTDEQKAELEKMDADRKAKAAEKRSDRKQEKKGEDEDKDK